LVEKKDECHAPSVGQPLEDQIKNPEHDEQADEENDADNPTQNLEHICLRCLL
jgi:hypothetical protein